jgi:hypothetical protein
MKKYAIRLSIAILTCSIGTAASYLSSWTVRTIQYAKAERPYSVLQGTTVRIRPWEATFQIPESWLTPDSPFADERKLYLSEQDLMDLPRNNGGDAEDAQVMDAVFPLAQCAAHFGDRGWGNYFWGDLQGRVYITDRTPAEVAAAIQTSGLHEAASVFENAELSWESYGVWQKLSLTVIDASEDFSLMKNLDFYYRPIGGKTVVFVYLHAGGYESTIKQMLNSFDCTSCDYAQLRSRF